MPKAEVPEPTIGGPLSWRRVTNVIDVVQHYRLDGDRVSGGYLSFFNVDDRGTEVPTAELFRAGSDSAPKRYTTQQRLLTGLEEIGLQSPLPHEEIPLPK